MKLLTHFDIHTPITSYHEYNKIEKAHELVKILLSGKNVVLITDAGTPAISDPGEDLVRLCAEAGVPVTAIPGPCAAITALAVSGLSTIVLVLMHSGKGTGVSDMIAASMYSSNAGSGVWEKNLDRLTVITSVTFGVCVVIMALTFPLGII